MPGLCDLSTYSVDCVQAGMHSLHAGMPVIRTFARDFHEAIATAIKEVGCLLCYTVPGPIFFISWLLDTPPWREPEHVLHPTSHAVSTRRAWQTICPFCHALAPFPAVT